MYAWDILVSGRPVSNIDSVAVLQMWKVKPYRSCVSSQGRGRGEGSHPASSETEVRPTRLSQHQFSCATSATGTANLSGGLLSHSRCCFDNRLIHDAHPIVSQDKVGLFYRSCVLGAVKRTRSTSHIKGMGFTPVFLVHISVSNSSKLGPETSDNH